MQKGEVFRFGNNTDKQRSSIALFVVIIIFLQIIRIVKEQPDENYENLGAQLILMCIVADGVKCHRLIQHFVFNL